MNPLCCSFNHSECAAKGSCCDIRCRNAGGFGGGGDIIRSAWDPRLNECDVARTASLNPTPTPRAKPLYSEICYGFDAGLVPEQTVQREADEAAECAGCTAARLLQGPQEDEAPGRQAGGSGHLRTRGLRILRRYDWTPFLLFCIICFILMLIIEIDPIKTIWVLSEFNSSNGEAVFLPCLLVVQRERLLKGMRWFPHWLCATWQHCQACALPRSSIPTPNERQKIHWHLFW